MRIVFLFLFISQVALAKKAMPPAFDSLKAQMYAQMCCEIALQDSLGKITANSYNGYACDNFNTYYSLVHEIKATDNKIHAIIHKMKLIANDDPSKYCDAKEKAKFHYLAQHIRDEQGLYYTK